MTTPTDPREPPMAQLPPSSPTPPPREPLKSFGQEYQYAETLQNPYPEVVFTGPSNPARGAASTSPAIAGVGDRTQEASSASHDAFSSHRPDTAGSKNTALHEDIWVEPRGAPWYKAVSPKKWAIVIVCTLGVTGVVLAILGAMNKLTPSSSSDQSSPTDNSNSTSTATISSSTTTSSATSLPTSPTTPKLDCHDPTTFQTSITWIGTEVGAYKGEFAQASSAESCCDSCRTHAPGGGCAGWLYNAGSTFTPCTKIIVTRGSTDDNDNDKKGGGDDICPKGYASTTFFARDGGGKGGGGVAGMGPCGRTMEVQG